MTPNCVFVCVFARFRGFYYLEVFDLEGSVCIWTVMSQWFLFSVPKCAFYAPLTPLYTQYINVSWRRPFEWKFAWFMTRFYSIFHNQPAHFCTGLVVAVVMPQYSAAAPLQRAFCSHAPSQKHGVTSVAKVDQLGCFVLDLCVFLFFPLSLSLVSPSPLSFLILQKCFFFAFLLRFTLDRNKSYRQGRCL